MDGFSLTYDGFDSGAEGLREALTSTGNGYLCTRGAAEWEDADGVHYPGTYVHGGYNRETTILGGLPVLNEDLVNLPNWLVLQLRIEGEDAIRLADVELLGYPTSSTSGTRPSSATSASAIAAAGRRHCRAAGLSAWRTLTTPGLSGRSSRRTGRGASRWWRQSTAG